MREPLQPDQIRAIRKAAGLDQVELADRLGVPVANVMIWESTYDLVYLEPAVRERLVALAPHIVDGDGSRVASGDDPPPSETPGS
ncbi:MAG TPA: hypothetical protein VHL09_14760 [Dehalococcoidia bacterium]|nr:hypothetical protein [Dehalococcoidia bacterium]